jgi:hypothetical protein
MTALRGRAPAGFRGTGTLFVNGQKVAEGRIPKVTVEVK